MESKNESEMRSEIVVRYVLVGPELDPDRITAVTGLAPSDSWQIGDRRLPKLPHLRSRTNGWAVASGLPPSVDLEEQVKSVLDRLQPAWEAFCQLGIQYDAVISCIVKSYGGDRPAIHFENDVIKRIAELNATIDVDLYVFD